MNPAKATNSLVSTGPQGLLLVDKPRGVTSFSLVGRLRKICGVKTIGHAGTLDPFATGLMIMLIGRPFTRLSDQFLNQDKEYLAALQLGIATDSFDCEGEVISTSNLVPTFDQLLATLTLFQGTIQQIPPMFSAKKINGQKLCDLARRGISLERKPVSVNVHIELCRYDYPLVELRVRCSKGTYIRSLAHDIGQALGCGAHLTDLRRCRSGRYDITDSVDGLLLKPGFNVEPHLRTVL